MARVQKEQNLPKAKEIKLDKIPVYFRRSILKSILKILVMEHPGFRTFKAVKNINRLFSHIDLSRYKTSPELEAYIWAISFVSKHWLDGIVSPELIYEIAKKHPDYTDIAGDLILSSMNDKNIISPPEAKEVLNLVSDALKYGMFASVKDEYIKLLDDINMDEPGAFKKLSDRIFLVSQSMLDIKYNTNMVANKVEFNSADIDSVKEALQLTLQSISSGSGIYKTGIRRLNTLLSPGYMDGKLYTWLGLPGSFKSGMLLKSALDIRKYNPGVKPKTPGMKPCVLYITMENTFEETVERIWNMTFDEPMTNFSIDEVCEKFCNELGIKKIKNDEVDFTPTTDDNFSGTLLSQLELNDKHANEPNMEIVLQYYPYRSINTDDLFTIINDLREENLEVMVLVFDYIKRIEPAVPIHDNTKLELGRIINELKALAVIQNIPVITAHQLNRSAAATVDAAARAGKADATRLAGRENVGDAWDVVESSDVVGILGREYKPGTEELYLVINMVKRRRIDASEAAFAKYTYLAHPFAKNNGMRLIDDINLDKVLSLQSLGTDIDILGVSKEKANATQRLQQITQKEFDEDY